MCSDTVYHGSARIASVWFEKNDCAALRAVTELNNQELNQIFTSMSSVPATISTSPIIALRESFSLKTK